MKRFLLVLTLALLALPTFGRDIDVPWQDWAELRAELDTGYEPTISDAGAISVVIAGLDHEVSVGFDADGRYVMYVENNDQVPHEYLDAMNDGTLVMWVP